MPRTVSALRIPAATTPTTPPEPPLFRTRSTNIAATLIASNFLAYKTAELLPKGDGVVFVFDDPLNQGEDLVSRYDAGALPRVEAKALFSARGFLLEVVARVKKAGVRSANQAR